MSADPIRKNIKEWKKLYDFKDFVTCVEKLGIAKEMRSLDFFIFETI